MDTTRIFTGALAVLLGLVVYRSLHPSTTFAADGLDSRWDYAVQESRDSGKPTLVLFTADWCSACQALHRTLATPAAQAELAHYYVFTVNLTNETHADEVHASQFGARYIPLLIRDDTDEKETDRTNSLPPEELVEWLKDGE
jgi:thiol:disulfide interchange protein